MLRARTAVGKSIRQQHFLRLVDHLVAELPHDDAYLVLDAAFCVPPELLPTEPSLRWFTASFVNFTLGQPTDFAILHPELAEWLEEWLATWQAEPALS